MKDLLLEIGSEEIPAGYIEPALVSMASGLTEKLKEARIEHGSVKTYGTPKRLAIFVENVSEVQKSLTTEVTGPPEKVGFDEDGKPRVPAVKFAEKLGISVEEIRITETDKGRYLCGSKTEEAVGTTVVLQKMLPELILKVTFPKTMRWADLTISFARPIHSILALFGDNIVPFEIGDVKSGNAIYGHRFMNPAKIELQEPANYLDKLRDANVIASIEERKKRVKEDVEKTAQSIGGNILPDDELLNIVSNLIEYPVVVVGSFDKEFLELPDEVLITSMREHQKYFAVVDDKSNLMPNFVVVNNTRTKDMAVVTKGHEKVLRARLADAQFFYKADLNETEESRKQKLKGVLFQASLGTMFDKTGRIEKLAGFLADLAGMDDIKNHVVRAAKLCKSDLVSQVVVEFPKLQGVMGRIYANIAGEAGDTALAIEEHYKPLYSGATLPETMVGAFVAIADKIDTICGCFSAGLIPTGASDPYALRRQSIGIVQIMLDKKFRFSLKSIIEKSVSLYGERSQEDLAVISEKVYEFIKNRIEHLLVEEGFSKDVTLSVSSVSIDNIPHVRSRVKALESLKSRAGFEPIAVAFKRVVNIIKKAELAEGISVDESLFQDKCESGLYSALIDVKLKVENCLENENFDSALSEIAGLREPVDVFFDDVMVMVDDEKVRNNRLAILDEIAGLFANIADFSRISI